MKYEKQRGDTLASLAHLRGLQALRRRRKRPPGSTPMNCPYYSKTGAGLMT
jgi:hypothetical protein